MTGSGTPSVLALHGWARSHLDFDAVLQPADGDALPALAPDLPGFGATPAPPEPWGSAQYADCVAGVLDEMSEPVVVLGHSFGGRVAVHLAASRPERVRALVLTSAPLVRLAPPRRPATAYRIVRALHRAGLMGDERMESARRRHGSQDYAAAEGVMRQVHVRVVGESYEAQLDAIECPVVLVWGDDDTTVPLAVAEAAAGRLARSELVVCPGAGHLVPLTAPDALREAVRRWMG